MAGSRVQGAVEAADVRGRIAAAARDLFADRGYDNTTVDAIAERAGIARRTFFRYFRSKDDVILPDHDRISRAVIAHLGSAGHLAPVEAVCAAARIVFSEYVVNRQVSVQRYLVSRSVPALRDRESANVSRYCRLFGRYLRERYGPAPDAALRAEVGASAVIAAHNQVLREWLQGRGEGDPMPALDAALAWVCATFDHGSAQHDGNVAVAAPGNGMVHGPAVPCDAVIGGSPIGAGAGRRAGVVDPVPVGDGEVRAGQTIADGEQGRRPGEPADVVVAVFRSDQSIEDVLRHISGSLRP